VLKKRYRLIPGAKGQNHAILNAGHFIQEEKEKNLLNLLFNFTYKQRMIKLSFIDVEY
jgi:hypothetical protein